MTHEELIVTHDNLVQDDAFITKKLSSKKTKTCESSSLGSNDQSHYVANSCDVENKHVSTSCDYLLYMPCSSHICVFLLPYLVRLTFLRRKMSSKIK
jgi:hypothetical protein